MNDSPLQLTKREMQTLLTARATWIGVGAAGVIFGLAGPFGTEVLPTLPRIVYWLIVSVVGFLLGTLVSTFVAETLRAYRMNRWVAVVVAAIVAGIVNLGALLILNWLVFRLVPSEPGYLPGLAINVVVISIVIAWASVSIQNSIRREDTKATVSWANGGTSTATFESPSLVIPEL